MKKLIKIISVIILLQHNICIPLNASKKIVGLMQIRNEGAIIEQCLHGLSLFTDAIVILDDASQDNTLSIIKSVAHPYKIEKIIANSSCAWVHGLESDNRQKLLEAGRAIGGTHFIIIDADEMFTATLLKDNVLRKLVLALEPGDRLEFHWIRLWKSWQQFRSDGILKDFVFCDDGTCFYDQSFIHVPRIPHNLKKGNVKQVKPYYAYGLLHFQASHWPNMELRRAWYYCFMRVKKPQLTDTQINTICHSDDTGVQLMDCPNEWFDGYSFLSDGIPKPETLREQQILDWFATYGKRQFAGLNIWNIDWPENIV